LFINGHICLPAGKCNSHIPTCPACASKLQAQGADMFPDFALCGGHAHFIMDYIT